MLKLSVPVGCVFLLSVLLSLPLNAADPSDFVDFSTEGLPGQLFVPPEAEDSARPIIVFLHGAGETGTNNRSQINNNIDNLLSAAKDHGAFLYAPQATTVQGGIFNWNDQDRTAGVMTMVDQILSDRNADMDRVYITGLSMGGGGTWNMVSRYPDRFAAAVPIAGVRTANDFEPANMLGTPTWAFHARNDGVITRERSRGVVNDILSAAGEPTLTFPDNRDRSTFEFVSETLDLAYTEYPTGGHGIWPRVYSTPEVYDWMFAQSVPEPHSTSLLAIVLMFVLGRCRRVRPSH